MSFKRVETRQSQPSDPTLRISPKSPAAYLSVGAIRKWFEDVERVTFYVDEERSRIALAREDGDHSYSLNHRDGAGASVAVRQALRQLDVEYEDLEEAIVCPIEKDADSSYVYADVREVVEAATDDVHCPECGKRYARSGLKTHLGRTHDEDHRQNILKRLDADDVGEPAPDGDDSWKEMYDEGAES